MKNIWFYKISRFPESYNHSKTKIKVKLDFSNYATTSNLKGATGIDTSIFAKEVDLANWKSDIDKFDTEKLETTPVNFSKWCSKKELLNYCVSWTSCKCKYYSD